MANKTPKHKAHLPPKGARAGVNPEYANQQTPVWSIIIFDHESEWGKDRCQEEDSLWVHIFPGLLNYEKRTWGEILGNRKRDHSCSIDSISKKARDRLKELKLDDIDSLFRFRLSGKQRVWGIREGRVFKLLWWDPDHEVYPSTLT